MIYTSIIWIIYNYNYVKKVCRCGRKKSARARRGASRFCPIMKIKFATYIFLHFNLSSNFVSFFLFFFLCCFLNLMLHSWAAGERNTRRFIRCALLLRLRDNFYSGHYGRFLFWSAILTVFILLRFFLRSPKLNSSGDCILRCIYIYIRFAFFSFPGFFFARRYVPLFPESLLSSHTQYADEVTKNISR